MDRWWDAGRVGRGDEKGGVPSEYLRGTGRGDGGGVNMIF